MTTFFVVSYIFSLILSSITLIIGICIGKKRLYTVRILPRALRIYLISCCFSYFILISICSIFVALLYLILNSEKHIAVEIVKNLLVFSSQQIRNAFTFIMFERIIATVKLENYKMAGKNSLLCIFIPISYTTSLFYVGYTIFAKSRPDIPILFNVINYYIYFAHIFMLGVCAILYLMNKRMYKLSAYRITLKKRYAISQNVKSLKYLFPTILIYSIFAQFASMINIIAGALNLPTPPVAVFHTFFSVSFLLIYIRYYYVYPDKISNVTNTATVTNPVLISCNKNILINVTTDQYFQGLHNQWK